VGQTTLRAQMGRGPVQASTGASERLRRAHGAAALAGLHMALLGGVFPPKQTGKNRTKNKGR
jgi:hypothetical protein